MRERVKLGFVALVQHIIYVGLTLNSETVLMSVQ